MYLQQGIKLLLFCMLVSNIQSSKLVRRESSSGDLLQENIKAYEELVNDLQNGVGDLYVGDTMTEIAKTIAELHYSLDEAQQKAFNDILNINKDSLLAIDAARVVVMKLKNIVKLAVYAVSLDESDTYFQAAIQVFLTSSEKVPPEIEKAIEKIVIVIADSAQVAGSFTTLITWVEKKQRDFLAKSAAEQEQARIEAYGASASCLAAGPGAIIACPIAYAVAVGVTEGITVEGIKKNFENAINDISGLKTQIQTLETKTNALITFVKDDYIRLTDIQSSLDSARTAAGATSISFLIFFEPFKTEIKKLDALCDAYLDRYSSIITGKRQLD